MTTKENIKNISNMVDEIERILKEDIKITKKINGDLVNKFHNIKQGIKSITNSYERCWLCSSDKDLTQHHLQQVRKRKINGTITLCRDCHDYIENWRRIVSIMKREEKITVSKLKELLKRTDEKINTIRE